MPSQERPTTPDLGDVIQAWIERYLEDVHTAFVGRIVAYDASTQKADVQPMAREPRQLDDGSYTFDALPILPAVSVVQPRTHGWALALPVDVGDSVLVVCQQTSPGPWESGDGTQVTDPGADVRRHSLAHAVALVGYLPVLKKLSHVAPAPGTWPASAGAQPNELGDGTHAPGIVLGAQDTDGPRLAICQDPTTRQSYVAVTVNGVALLRIDADGKVHAGGFPAADFVALAAKVDQVFTDLKNIFDNWTVVPNDGGQALKTLLAGWTPATVRAAKLRGT